ncbi:radical SAM protein [Acetatifactor muris]|uniref:Cyclic pyranopterin monophosphate synthase n=1 Tax=Acetatifactor muris TaxID=879566 RepID=A0A2K4ZG61_9FIRM|nr:radical SAM protein [Acetatifactor muris]MCR2045719.1 radical SAM protein [Acetatifactor muris]SOY29457.1 Cyclic pyranopterin monophosphate synthase [Acetatifactor muris]
MDNNFLERISMLPLWDMMQEVDKIEDYSREHKEKTCICHQLEHFEKLSHRKKYIVIGAGKDGNELVRLLNVMGKEITNWGDNSKDKIGKNVYGYVIHSVDDILKRYSGEVILIASRKYEIELLNQVLEYKIELKSSIFDYDEIYTRGMWARESRKKAVLSYPPMKITIGITSACPNKCLFCSYHGEAAREVSNTYNLPYMLSYKDFCKMIDMAKQGGVPHIHICGTGEPFVNPEVLKMIDYVIKNYGYVSLQTDFWKELFQKRDYLNEIIKREKYITYIATDILSSKEEEHNAIKQGMKYCDLMDMLEYLGRNSNVRIRAVNILTRSNFRYLRGIIDDLLLRKVNFELWITNLLSYDYSPYTSSDNVYQSGDIEITKALAEVEEYAKEKGVKIGIPEPADYERECSVFWESFQTWPVRGCEKERYVENMIPHACAAVVRGKLNSQGYLFDYDNIMDAWNNEIIVKIRENILKNRYPDEWCKKCFMYQDTDSYFKKV